MKTRIFDVKTRYASLLALMLGLVVAGPALAQCNVILSAILPSNQAVLKAECGAANMTEITWTRDLNAILPLVPVVLSNSTFPATLADINFTTLLTSGTHSYTASGFFGGTPGVPGTGTPVAAGKAAVITLSQPILTVAVSPGGTVNGVPPGINACKSTTIAGDALTGICAAGYDTGTSVVLTPTADTGSVLASWGGDCSGTASTANCTLSMTTLRTATATFSAVPTPGACGSASNSTPVASAPSSNLCSAGTASLVTDASNTYSWTCAGVNGGTASPTCSAPKIVAGVCGTANGGASVSATPTGTAACNPGTATGMTAGATQFTWTCAGFNTGAPSGQCAVNITPTAGVCGSAHLQNVAATPTGAELCSAGTNGTVTNLANTFSWTCNGLAGGTSSNCMANQIVAGVCGSSNGLSLSTAPSTNLCSVGTNTAVTGTGPWNWTCTGLNTGSSASCSASLSTGAATCSPPAGFSCNQSPFTYEAPTGGSGLMQFDINTQLTYKFRAPANQVNVHPITFSASFYTGAKAALSQAVTTTNINNRDYVISLTPGSQTAVSPYCKKVNQNLANVINISFNAALGYCPLTKGTQYYLNVKASAAGVTADYLLNATPLQ